MCATKAPKNFASPYMMQQMGGGQPPSVFAPGAQPNVDVTNQAKPMPSGPNLTGDAGPPQDTTNDANDNWLMPSDRPFGDMLASIMAGKPVRPRGVINPFGVALGLRGIPRT